MENPEKNTPQSVKADGERLRKLTYEIEYCNTVLDTINEIIYKLNVGGSFEPDDVKETLSTLASHAIELTDKRNLLVIEQDGIFRKNRP